MVTTNELQFSVSVYSRKIQKKKKINKKRNEMKLFIFKYCSIQTYIHTTPHKIASFTANNCGGSINVQQIVVYKSKTQKLNSIAECIECNRAESATVFFFLSFSYNFPINQIRIFITRHCKYVLSSKYCTNIYVY